MTDVTKDWTGSDALRESADPAVPASPSTELIPDQGEHTPPAATASAEARTFDESAKPAQHASSDAGGEEAGEPLLRATLETIRVKAEALRGQATDWAQVRQKQARDVIDERPVTAVAAAFGVGLLLGALLSR
jgi:ElaB/YqjD/DUF883 family membrane-anchored ribosome-binding protein